MIESKLSYNYQPSYEILNGRGIEIDRPWGISDIILNYADKSKILLDIGCGTGIKLKPLFNSLGDIVGLEPNQLMYNTAVELQSSLTLSKVVQYIKGKSGRKLLMEFAHLRKRYWGQHLWARGYFAVTVGNVNEQEVQKYLEEQEVHHKQDNFKISEY